MQTKSHTLSYYTSCFSAMNCNKQRGLVAPHKAMMLIAVMDEVANGRITHGFVPHNDFMVRAFERAWNKYVGTSAVFNPVFATPFYHLSYEPFWKLMKTDEYVEMKEYSLGRLRTSFYGAKLPDDLFAYMENADSRMKLKLALLETFIPNWEEDIYASIVANSNDKEYNESHRKIVDRYVA